MDNEQQTSELTDSEREAQELVGELMALVRLEIATPLEKRIAELERRLSTLESNQRP
jgi:chaperonin cofactor prefoldin